MDTELRDILLSVKNGGTSVDEALLKLKKQPYIDIGYAKIDLHRKLRTGQAEMIYGASKTAEQISGILSTMKNNGQDRVIVTRLSAEKAEAVSKHHDISYVEIASIAVIGEKPQPDGIGTIVIATGGTSDIPVAEEAAVTAEML